jgi:hypothetical protein
VELKTLIICHLIGIYDHRACSYRLIIKLTYGENLIRIQASHSN